MSLPLIQINGKCEVPIQIKVNFRCCLQKIKNITKKNVFLSGQTDRRTHVQLKTIVRNLTKYKNIISSVFQSPD